MDYLGETGGKVLKYLGVGEKEEKAEKAELGAECCTPPPPATKNGLVGLEEKLNGMDCYINWGKGHNKAIVFATDVFGWRKPLTRKLADDTAAVGFVTVVPDYLQDDPLDSGEYGSEGSLNSAKWKEKHNVETSFDEFLGIIKALKEKGITSVGMAGFCFGATPSIFAAKEGVLDAVVILHPSPVPLDMIKAVKVPLAILSPQNDRQDLIDLRDEYQKYFRSQSEIEWRLKVFPGVGHGWTVRYDEKDADAVRSAMVAHMDMIYWFEKHLKENSEPSLDQESSNSMKENLGRSPEQDLSNPTKENLEPLPDQELSNPAKENFEPLPDQDSSNLKKKSSRPAPHREVSDLTI